MVRVTICDRCRKPIEGDHAADGFTIEEDGVTYRIRVEGEPGKARPDFHRACVRAAIGEISEASRVVDIQRARR